MAEFSKEDLLKLSPGERIKKLKELEEQRKKELEELEEERKKEIDESAKMLKQAEMEMFEKAVADDRPPEDLREFSGRKLEETISKEKIPDVPPEDHVQYGAPLDNAADLYNKIKAYAGRDAPLTGEEAQTVGYLYDVFNEVVDNAEAEEQRIEEIASGVKRMVKDIMGEYQANVKYDSEIK